MGVLAGKKCTPLTSVLRALASATVMVAVAMFVVAPVARASVVITGTRVIYPAGNRDVTIRVTNNGETPALVQSWVDAGNPQAAPEQLDVPFSVTPSIFRLDPPQTQVMRLVFLGADLPKDRESVYWLNVLEIPPKPKDMVSENYLQFAIKTRIKIFYRPAMLPGGPEKSASQLKWARAAGVGNEVVVTVRNPSAFYVSFAEVRAKLADGTELPALSGMVAPFDVLTLKFVAAQPVPSPVMRVTFKTVDDYGSFVDGTVELP